MKKTILAIFAIALATILPTKISAEDTTEYNMVITLQNGTTITLGHNDIKNITFNGEEISIVGNAANSIEENKMHIEELWMQLENTQNFITQVLNMQEESTEEVNNEIEQIYMQLSQSQEMLSQLLNAEQADVEEIRANLQELWEAVYGENGLTTQMSQYYNTAKGELEEYAEIAKEELEKVYTQVRGYVDYLMNEAAILKDKVASLEERIEKLENKE